jgi:diguanylate cyclase (GGDEF)-like protein
MNSDLHEWQARLVPIDFAFQPIVNIHTGACFGFEALMRNIEEAGFNSIADVFDTVNQDHMLHQVDLFLRRKALNKYIQIEGYQFTKLFYNLDNRLFDSVDYQPGNTCKTLAEMGIPMANICFEISERHELDNVKEKAEILNQYRQQGYKIAVDDCGTGFSGLQILYYTKPDYIKIDRFFIKDIENDPEKRLLVSMIVNIAHIMGSIVIAEGVETIQEYYSCKSIGCDLLQGFLVHKPELDVSKLRLNYNCINLLRRIDRRNKTVGDKSLIKAEIKYIDPVQYQTDLLEVFEIFRSNKVDQFIPVINEHEEPMGVIRELAIKDFAYSKYGRSLLENKSFQKKISDHLSKFAVADIHSTVEKILEIYSMNEEMEGILIVDNMKYTGFLSAHSMLKILNEKNLAIARDQNPLSKLPGNTMIYAYVSNALQDFNLTYHLIYFDFDNFKAYNDKYGFRFGDRIILLFAEILKKKMQASHMFIGHVGGDDFFAGISGVSTFEAIDTAKQIASEFESNVKGFYDEDAMKSGFIMGKDRNGKKKKMPLLTVSTVLIELPAMIHRIYSPEEVSNFIANLKKEAKRSPDRLKFASIQDFSWQHSEISQPNRTIQLAS